MATIKTLRGTATVSKRSRSALVLHGTEDQMIEHGANALELIATGSGMAVELALDVGAWAFLQHANASPFDPDAARKSAINAIDAMRDRVADRLGELAKDTIAPYLSRMRRIAGAVAVGHELDDATIARGLKATAAACPSEHSGRGRPKATKADTPAAAMPAPAGSSPKIKGFADDLAKWAAAVGDTVGAASVARFMAENPEVCFDLLASYMNDATAPKVERKLRRAA